MSSNRYTRTVPTGEFEETPRLILEQATGDVKVVAWDRPEIEISVDDDREVFDVDVQGSQVIVKAKAPSREFRQMVEPAVNELNNLGIGIDRVAARIERNVQRSMRRLQHDMRVNVELGRWTSGRDYEIKVPVECNVSLRTSTGDLNIEGVHGTLFTQATSGDVRMKHIEGAVLVASASGDITINGLAGKLGAHSASGDIEVGKGSLNEVSVHSASGDIELELLTTPEREFEARSTSGDVNITLPGDARISMEVSTLSGDINCGFRHERLGHERVGRGRATSLILNGGGVHAHIATVSGDINVVPRRGEEPVAPTGMTTDLGRTQAGAEGSGDIQEPEGYVARQEAELEILQAVERGEITPQEAMARLSDLASR